MDGRVTMQNTLIIGVVVKLKGVMLLSGIPKTFPFCHTATIHLQLSQYVSVVNNIINQEFLNRQ